MTTATATAPTAAVVAPRRRKPQGLPWGPWPVYVFAALVIVALLTPVAFVILGSFTTRSEERRVGKECRSRWSPYH